jgi:hypothetical protein
LAGGVWLVQAGWLTWISFTQPGAVGRDALGVFGMLPRLLLPTMHLAADQPANAYLSAEMTPPVLPVLAALGVYAGTVRRESRAAVLGISLCALLLTLVGLHPGRLNLARLQYGAQPFYAVLAGIGMAWLTERRVWRRGNVEIAGAAGAVALLLFLWLFPGPIGRRTTLQVERRLFIDALGQLRDGCSAVWPPAGGEPNPDAVPTYLAEERGRFLRWGALTSASTPPPTEGCVYYYRPSTCYVKVPGEQGAARLSSECAALEQQLELDSVFTRDLPNVPDDKAEYRADELRVGFYRITGATTGNPRQ